MGLKPDGTPEISYTRRGGANGVCAILENSAGGGLPIEAEGPDFFRVRGVASSDVLNVREGPTAGSPIVGVIPPDGNGIRNLGCRGGLSFGEWQKASPRQRQAAERVRWYRVEYRGLTGWAAGRFLGEGTSQ